MEAYILNTGSIGAREGGDGEKITIRISTEIMKQIARKGIAWQRDPDWGYEIPVAVPGIDLTRYDPRSHYSEAEYAARIDKLRQERREWLARFPGLDPAIPASIGAEQ
jgi:phosphoenolpyruvate carboxykinase (ATP)